MRVHRSRILRLSGRKPGSKSPVLRSGATEPAILFTGISCTPPNARPSIPAARSIGSIERSRSARPVRIVRRLRQNARARAASKSWIARMRSIPKPAGAQRVLCLEESLLAFGVEEVKHPGVQPQLHAVSRRDGHPRIDSRRELVATNRPVEELVGAKSLHDVDLHFKRRTVGGRSVGDRLRTETERSLL